PFLLRQQKARCVAHGGCDHRADEHVPDERYLWNCPRMAGGEWARLLPENDIDDEANHHAEDGAVLGGAACERAQQEGAEHFTPGDGGDGETNLDDMAASLREDGEHEQHE